MFSVDGRETDPTNPPTSEFHVVRPEYFEALRIPLRTGSLPDPWVEGDEMPIVVNERFAAAFWPEGDALGRGISWEGAQTEQMRVVAVVGDV